MKNTIRMQTRLIIRRNGEYLQGRIIFSNKLRWSRSAWDAWGTRDREKAREIARRTGGTVMLFNPVAGQMKVL